MGIASGPKISTAIGRLLHIFICTGPDMAPLLSGGFLTSSDQPGFTCTSTLDHSTGRRCCYGGRSGFAFVPRSHPAMTQYWKAPRTPWRRNGDHM